MTGSIPVPEKDLGIIVFVHTGVRMPCSEQPKQITIREVMYPSPIEPDFKRGNRRKVHHITNTHTRFAFHFGQKILEKKRFLWAKSRSVSLTFGYC